MNAVIGENELRSAVNQLRRIAAFLEQFCPSAHDQDRPEHERLSYIERPRSFGDAFASKARKRKGTR